MKDDKKFTVKHPYLTNLLAIVVGSMLGILLSILFTGSFNEGGIYFSLLSILTVFISIKIKSRKNKQKD